METLEIWGRTHWRAAVYSWSLPLYDRITKLRRIDIHEMLAHELERAGSRSISERYDVLAERARDAHFNADLGNRANQPFA